MKFSTETHPPRTRNVLVYIDLRSKSKKENGHNPGSIYTKPTKSCRMMGSADRTRSYGGPFWSSSSTGEGHGTYSHVEWWVRALLCCEGAGVIIYTFAHHGTIADSVLRPACSQCKACITHTYLLHLLPVTATV